MEYTYQSCSSDNDSILGESIREGPHKKASANIFLKNKKHKKKRRNKPITDKDSEKRPRSVLDELENYWQKNDQSKGLGKRGILAEHIMEQQARGLKEDK